MVLNLCKSAAAGAMRLSSFVVFCTASSQTSGSHGFGVSPKFQFSFLRAANARLLGKYSRTPVSLLRFALGGSCVNRAQCCAGNSSCSRVCGGFSKETKNHISIYCSDYTHQPIAASHAGTGMVCVVLGFFSLA